MTASEGYRHYNPAESEAVPVISATTDAPHIDCMTQLNKTPDNNDRPCMLEESLDVQVELIESIRYRDEHDRQRALGAILLTRQALKLHKQRRNCWNDCKGSPNCSIRDWVMMSRSGAAVTWKPEDFTADLSAGLAVLERDNNVVSTILPMGFRSDFKNNTESNNV
jgi:hypothetical protein